MSKMTMRQLDPGTFTVTQSGVERGQVFAEGTAGEMVVEHWVLLDGFASPTLSIDMKVHAAKAADSYSSFSAFMTAMQVVIDASGKPGQYVKATCVYETMPTT